MFNFVLASSSSRRIEILKSLGFNFKVVPHRYIEPKVKIHPLPKKFVEDIAIKKAKSLAKEYKNCVIIGVDTIVVLKNEIIGKPKDVAEAKYILTKLSGTKHKVLSGICLFYPEKKVLLSGVEISTVWTYKLKKKQIEKLAPKHLDKAGAYAVQQKNDKFVKKIVGDYYNVVGFPVNLFLELYKNLIQNIFLKK